MGWHLVHLISGVQVKSHWASHAAIETCDAHLVLERSSACLSKVITELLVKHLLVRSILRRCSCVWHHELSTHIHLWHLHLSLCLCLHLGLRLYLRLNLCLSHSLRLCLLVLLLHHKLTLPSPGRLNIHAHLRVHHGRCLLWSRLENVFRRQNGLGEEKVIWLHYLFVLIHLALHIHLVLKLLQFILIPIFLFHHLNLLLEVGRGRCATADAIFIHLAELLFHSVVCLLLWLCCFLRCRLLLLLLVLDLVYAGLLVHVTRWTNALVSLLDLSLACGILFHFFVDLLRNTIVGFVLLVCRVCLCLRLLHRNRCCHNGLRMHLRLLSRKIDVDGFLLLLVLIIGILTRLCLLNGSRRGKLVADWVLLLLTTFLAIIIWCGYCLLQLLCINLYKTKIKVMIEWEVRLCPFSPFTDLII